MFGWRSYNQSKKLFLLEEVVFSGFSPVKCKHFCFMGSVLVGGGSSGKVRPNLFVKSLFLARSLPHEQGPIKNSHRRRVCSGETEKKKEKLLVFIHYRKYELRFARGFNKNHVLKPILYFQWHLCFPKVYFFLESPSIQSPSEIDD